MREVHEYSGKTAVSGPFFVKRENNVPETPRAAAVVVEVELRIINI